MQCRIIKEVRYCLEGAEVEMIRSQEIFQDISELSTRARKQGQERNLGMVMTELKSLHFILVSL